MKAATEKIHEAFEGAKQPGAYGADVDDSTDPSDRLVLSEEAWRGTFADYRAVMERTSEAPDSVHFATFWANAATRLRRRVFVHYAYTHFANVFLVNFGPTGDSKTSGQRRGLKLLPSDGSVRVLRGIGSAEALGDWMQAGGALMSHLIYQEELGTLLSRGGWEDAPAFPDRDV